MHPSPIVLLFLVLVQPGLPQAIDQTLVDSTFGQDVTEAAIRKIDRSRIFSDDLDFLRRIAFVETNFGRDPNTYKPDYFGGIWKVDETIFLQTKNVTRPSLVYENIATHFNITWSTVRWNDLIKPFYSALAVRLYFASLTNGTIPGTLNLQANYWRNNFRNNGSVEEFILLVNALERNPECQGMMDICMVLDGSGSIGPSDFQRAKSFAADLAGTFNLNSTRVALVLFGDNARDIFDFSNNFTSSQMNSTIRGIPYPPNDSTNTPAGLLMAVDMFNRSSVREGVPRVVATFTDGNHNLGNLAQALEAVKNASLVSFAVGIGSGIRQSELQQIALNELENVFTLTDFESLAGFFYKMNSETCKVPQQPEIGTNQTGTLAKNERRYFKFEISEIGITFTVNTGNITGWFSYTEETPTSAIHDGQIREETFIPFKNVRSLRQAQNSTANVYVTIQSKAEGNTEYTISTQEGNHAKGSSNLKTASNTLSFFSAVFALCLYEIQRY